MSWSSPESLPPLMFFTNTVVIDNSPPGMTPTQDSPLGTAEGAVLPIISSQRIKYFNATVVPSEKKIAPSVSSISNVCPRWSEWGTSQFTFDYLFILLTSSMAPERFKHRYREQYMDTIFKLSIIIESIGKMPDGSPPPSFFQSFYFVRRLFPNGFLAAEDFTKEVGALTVKLFALGIAVANQAIYEQRNLNLDWEHMCGIPDSHVDALETTALAALNGEIFDLSQNRVMYLEWLDHLGCHTQFQHSRTGQTYLQSTADLIAFAHARAFLLPRENRRRHIQPIQLLFLEDLCLMLLWRTGMTQLRPETQDNLFQGRTASRALPGGVRPTAADVLAALAEECTARLLYPLSARVNRSWSWSS